jgi:hypothetical protein
MKGYYKRNRQNMAELTSSSDLPENALQWAAVLKEEEPEFSYKFVNT